MSPSMRLLYSSTVASLPAPTLFVIGALALDGTAQILVGIMFVTVWMVTVAYLLMIGLPAYLVLSRMLRLRWTTMFCVGVAAAILPLIPLMWLPLAATKFNGFENGPPSYLAITLVAGLLGGVTAITFWGTMVAMAPVAVKADKPAHNQPPS